MYIHTWTDVEAIVRSLFEALGNSLRLVVVDSLWRLAAVPDDVAGVVPCRLVTFFSRRVTEEHMYIFIRAGPGSESGFNPDPGSNCSPDPAKLIRVVFKIWTRRHL